MAQFRKDTQQFLADSTTVFEVVMTSDSNGQFYDDWNRFPVALEAGQSDAFGRLRTSDAYTLGDYKHVYGIDPAFEDITSANGSVTFLPNQACARLTTANNSTSSVIHTTRFYHHYMPGKSQLIKSTFNFYGANTNVTKRSGYYDDRNGIFFEQAANGALNFTIRTYVSGVADDSRKVYQSNWNIDTCNGTGASGFNLDITKTQIFFIDFQWLGVGRVRCGFVNDGKFVPAHEFYNSNHLDTVYMSNPNLPIRCEIFNSGARTSNAYMDQICSTVISEGGYIEAGQDFATFSNLRTLPAGNTLPILAIKLKDSFNSYPNRVIARMGSVNLISTDENIRYELIKLANTAVISGGSWVNVHSSSAVEYNGTATSYTDGEIMDGGFVAANNPRAASAAPSAGTPSPNMASSAKKNYIAQNYYSNNSQVFVVTATNLATNATSVAVNMQWREIY
jgi:hypothetical protein